MSKNVVELNGVYVNPQGSHFQLFAQPMEDTSGMRPLREQLEPDWYLTWRNGTAYGMPRVASPKTSFGKCVTLKCVDEPQLVAAVTLDALLRKVEAKGRHVLRRRPFRYVGEHKDLMAVALGKLANPPRILSKFKIVGKYQFNAKLIEPRDGRTAIGLIMGLGTHWEINAPLTELVQAGVDLRGLAVVRRVRRPRERGLVGRVASLDGSRVLLADAYDGKTEVPVSEVWVERSRAVFTHCLRSILGTEYDDFEAQRRLAEAGFLSSVAFDQWVESMAIALRERLSPLDVGGGLAVTFGERIEIANTPDYESVSEGNFSLTRGSGGSRRLTGPLTRSSLAGTDDGEGAAHAQASSASGAACVVDGAACRDRRPRGTDQGAQGAGRDAAG